jgi:hypothetical protein
VRFDSLALIHWHDATSNFFGVADRMPRRPTLGLPRFCGGVIPRPEAETQAHRGKTTEPPRVGKELGDGPQPSNGSHGRRSGGASPATPLLSQTDVTAV